MSRRNGTAIAELPEDLTIEVRARAQFSPYDPGVSSGPVEACYPPEGGEFEDGEVELVIGKRVLVTLRWDDARELFGADFLDKLETQAWENSDIQEPDYDRLHDQARDDRLTGDAL